MTAPTAAPKQMTPEKLERELLARLGLDPSATPEDVGAAHQAVAAYLAAAPKGLRGWARTQAAGADEAYALLTDPAALARAAALVGAGARPAVLPGGPATPPAHRDTPVPAAAAAVPAAAALPAAGAASKPQVDEQGRRIVSDDEIDALLAEVDPAAPREVVGTPQQRAAAIAAKAAPKPSYDEGFVGGLLASKAFRNLALVGATVAAVGIVAVLGFNAGAPAVTGAGIGAGASAAPAASAPALDQAKVSELMTAIQANPNDTDSLMALGDEFFKARDYAAAGDWFQKVTALEPTNIRGFLALGAAAFNAGDLATAETAWKQAVAIDETNVEAHYDLGFLYLNKLPDPDMAGVQREWTRVVELAPDSEIAKTVQAHLDAFASFSPGPSSAPVASPSTGASPAPSGAPAESAAPAESPQP